MDRRDRSPPLSGREPTPPLGVQSDFGPGFRFGRYEVVRRLAKGGMAEILLARVGADLPGFRKLVVLKRILPELATQRDFIEMFVDEARLAATLQHPHIVQVFDVGHHEGSYFMAMEYLGGADLRSLGRGPERLPLEHVLQVMLAVCAGLHYAHDKRGDDGAPLGIVHRDVSPQNVIVTRDGGVKLVDFGIAKATNKYNETRTGMLKGKVPYMSPEQCLGMEIDRRSDIYSLGIMLWELVLGRRLYQGRSDYDTMREIVDGRVVPPREHDPLVAPALEAIVMRALDKDRKQRFQTARQVGEALEAFAREQRIFLSQLALERFMERRAEERRELDGESTQPVASARSRESTPQIRTPRERPALRSRLMRSLRLGRGPRSSLARWLLVAIGAAAAGTLGWRVARHLRQPPAATLAAPTSVEPAPPPRPPVVRIAPVMLPVMEAATLVEPRPPAAPPSAALPVIAPAIPHKPPAAPPSAALPVIAPAIPRQPPAAPPSAALPVIAPTVPHKPPPSHHR